MNSWLKTKDTYTPGFPLVLHTTLLLLLLLLWYSLAFSKESSFLAGFLEHPTVSVSITERAKPLQDFTLLTAAVTTWRRLVRLEPEGAIPYLYNTPLLPVLSTWFPRSECLLFLLYIFNILHFVFAFPFENKFSFKLFLAPFGLNAGERVGCTIKGACSLAWRLAYSWRRQSIETRHFIHMLWGFTAFTWPYCYAHQSATCCLKLENEK